MESSGGNSLDHAAIANDVDAPEIAFIMKTEEYLASHNSPYSFNLVATSGDRAEDVLGRLRINCPVAVINDGTEHGVPLDRLERKSGKRFRPRQMLKENIHACRHIASAKESHVCFIRQGII